MSIAVALMCRKGKKLSVVDPIWNLESGDLSLDSESFMETGEWVIAENKADYLVGKNLILCESRTGMAYAGGLVTGYSLRKDGNNNPRTTLHFSLDKSLIGTTVENWVEQNPVHYL